MKLGHQAEEELTGQLSIEQFRPLFDSLVEQGEVTETFDKVPMAHSASRFCIPILFAVM